MGLKIAFFLIFFGGGRGEGGVLRLKSSGLGRVGA